MSPAAVFPGYAERRKRAMFPPVSLPHAGWDWANPTAPSRAWNRPPRNATRSQCGSTPTLSSATCAGTPVLSASWIASACSDTRSERPRKPGQVPACPCRIDPVGGAHRRAKECALLVPGARFVECGHPGGA